MPHYIYSNTYKAHIDNGVARPRLDPIEAYIKVVQAIAVSVERHKHVRDRAAPLLLSPEPERVIYAELEQHVTLLRVHPRARYQRAEIST